MSINNRVVIGQCPRCFFQYGVATMPTLSGIQVVLCSGCYGAVLLSDWQKNATEDHEDAAQPTNPELNVQTALADPLDETNHPQPLPKGPSVSDYIPTTEQVRKSYIHAYASQQFFGPAASANRAGLGAEFDCWLEAHDAEIREQIAGEVRDALDTHEMTLSEATVDMVTRGYEEAMAVALCAIHHPQRRTHQP